MRHRSSTHASHFTCVSLNSEIVVVHVGRRRRRFIAISAEGGGRERGHQGCSVVQSRALYSYTASIVIQFNLLLPLPRNHVSSSRRPLCRLIL